MKKKVKLNDVNKAGWKVSKTDQKTVRAAKTTITTTRAMNTLAKNSEANLALTEKLIEAVETLPNKIVPPAPAIPDPAQNKNKKKFRFNVNRDKDGYIDYVIVEEL